MLRKCSGWQYNLLGVGKNFCIKTVNLHLTFGCKIHVFNNMMNSYFLGCMFVQVSWSQIIHIKVDENPSFSHDPNVNRSSYLPWEPEANRYWCYFLVFLFYLRELLLLSILRPENDQFPLVAHSENKIIFNNSFTDS